MVSWLHDVYLRLGFSSKAAKLLIREQVPDNPERPRLLTDKNVDEICIGNQAARLLMKCMTGGGHKFQS